MADDLPIAEAVRCLKDHYEPGAHNSSSAVRYPQVRAPHYEIKARPDEPFHEAWERFRDLLQKCPHHDMPKWKLVNFFHKGLNEAQSIINDITGQEVQLVANPRGVRIINDITGQEVHHEQVQAITTLRSGKRVENKVEEEAKKDENWKNRLEEKNERNETAQEVPPTTEPSPEQRHVVMPFPRRLQETSKAAKQASELQDIMEMFKQVKINLPLLDAIQQIPAYAKFLKDMYLGASVNLLPYSVYLQLRLGELKPTSTILQLADRSTKQPRGVIEDVIIKVDKFYFPVDLIVLDIEPV
ncbi:uncharacterized protein LOC132301769 [Cornus florida]|uniref:uncharacterized protein LOC132301769 n=1 Tax=Cornus florida TaxID=4283 RepID=UPI00289D9E9C|nr:uncharacterized protein LOC132301769 [Cornus florida]